MGDIFVSYASKDKFFAELLEKMLLDEKIAVWRDIGNLRAGDEWRLSIDQGISNARIMIVVLSPAACTSHYVTYEWATALAQKKTIVPILLEVCDRHPKLEPLQYVDFKSHNRGTWHILIQRLQELLTDEETEIPDGTDSGMPTSKPMTLDGERLATRITDYMNANGFRMVSFERVRELFGESHTDEYLDELVQSYIRFMPATLAPKRRGLALI